MIAAILRRVRAAVLRWNIASAEQYIAACERDGIMGTATLRAWRDQLAADRVALALLEQQR